MCIVYVPSAQATNRGYWDLWALDVGIVCFMQKPSYRNTPLGKMLSNSYGFNGWEAFDRASFAACLRSRQWASDRLCTEITNLDEKTFRDLQPLRKKHEAELQGLRNVVEYYYKSREPNGDAISCPAAK
jgi:hypothetical protein